MTEPLPYINFLSLVLNSEICLTDSGGLQEETSVLGVPCLTLRTETERPITVEEGTNKVIGTKKHYLMMKSFFLNKKKLKRLKRKQILNKIK